MATIYAGQLAKKIAQFEKEKAQVKTHLALLEQQRDALNAEYHKINALLTLTNYRLHTLKSALEIMKVSKREIAQYNSEHYHYLTHERLFHSKVNRLLILIMKASPHQSFKISELTQQALILDRQPDIIPTKLH